MIFLQTPCDGSWNMVGRKCYRPTTINRWAVVVYECEERFSRQAADHMVRNLVQQFAALGTPTRVLTRRGLLTAAGRYCMQRDLSSHSLGVAN